MPLALLLLGLIVARCALGADVAAASRVAPDYTAANIVNGADNLSGILAPNTIGTIYGTNLAYGTGSLTPGSVQGGVLPTVLGDSETQVFFSGYAADLYYVSPGQINFLVPPMMLAGPVSFWIAIDGLAGKAIPLKLATAAPGLFAMVYKNGVTYAIVTLVSGSLLTPSSPAKPGDVVVLWATGLGATTPAAVYGQLPTAAAPLEAGANLEVLLNGVALESSAIGYAGVAPGFAGLYQINLTLPKSTAANPEIRLRLDGATSIPKVYLPVGP
jgi:uncharacterized protein (TIGR03437 family)